MTKVRNQLQRDIVAELRWDPRTSKAGIRVGVKAGVVTVSGAVDTPAQRLEIERRVARVPGVLAIVNAIAVRLTSTSDTARYLAGGRGVSNLVTLRTAATEAAVMSRIEDALRRGAEIAARRIKVEVRDGRITLMGTVRSPAERIAAERAVWDGLGVKAVEDGLTIEPW